LGFDRGFDVYDDHFGWVVGFPETIWGRLLSSLQRRKNPHHVLERRAQRTVDQALEWLDVTDDRPFFSWIHLFDPHGPYKPPPPWDTQYYQGDDPYDPTQVSMQEVDGVAAYLQRDLEGVTDVQWPLSQYAGEVSYVDAQLGRIVEWLETREIREQTLVVVTGDHGESLGDGGVWFNHGGQLNAAELHVPMVMSWPTILPRSTEVSAFVEISDILPTLFEAIVQEPPQTSKGVSLMTAIYTNSHRGYARGICYDRKANLAQRAMDPDFKPTFRMSALQTIDGTYTFYEHNNVFESPDGVDAIEPVYSEVLKEVLALDQATMNSINPEVSEETRQRLEALGYVE
jgi:arylsulfatase A-like enzyme